MPEKDENDQTALNRSSMQSLQSLREQMKKCRLCQEEFGFEPRPVTFGNPNAKIMHISQAPGLKVHETGKPFNDLSGKCLRQQWYEISDEQFYNPDNFYFTTMGHCFPGKGDRGNYDRKPPKRCYDLWTSKEIELMDGCELYLVVGSEAASRLFPKKKLADLVFQDQTLNNKPCFVLPHPSPLNRRWLKTHPEFMEKRIPEIRKAIHRILDSEPESEQEKESGAAKG